MGGWARWHLASATHSLKGIWEVHSTKMMMPREYTSAWVSDCFCREASGRRGEEA